MKNNLEPLKKTSQKTVVLGMSGGVDSSVAAYLLQKQGYLVIGVFLKLYSDTKNSVTGECSYLEDLKMARKVALLLDIPLHVLDFEKEYKKLVLAPMFGEYQKGRTPNPDLLCNKLMKFPLLREAARKFGADYISTGHYARIRKIKNGFQLRMGEDRTKDQSYFLADLSQKDLSQTLFPLGSFKKKRVREIARKNGLPNWNKHGTVGICFVGQHSMHELLRHHICERKGDVLDSLGKKIGVHQGAAYSTIGQKAGEHIGVSITKPRGMESKRFYVATKNVRKNELVVAPQGHSLLKRKEIHLVTFHHVLSQEKIPSRLTARIRHLGQLHSGVFWKKGNRYEFRFDTPVEAIAPGQIAVLYQGESVVGCGEIRLK